MAYSADDSSDDIARLYDELAHRFGDDQISLSIALKPGSDVSSAVEMAIQTASVVVAVIGPSWKGPWLTRPDSVLRQQLASALSTPATPIVPVLINGADMPTSDELPEKLAALGRLHALSLLTMTGGVTLSDLPRRLSTGCWRQVRFWVLEQRSLRV